MAIKGLDRYLKRLRAIDSPEGRRNISKALLTAADEMKAHAQHMITEGSRSGRRVKGQVRKQYTASAPREPPTYDTETLKSHIEASQPRPMMAEVRSEAPYAPALEFGTSRMKERPYMAPTREAKRGRARELVEEAINETIRRAK